jgi:hypothetical protein
MTSSNDRSRTVGVALDGQPAATVTVTTQRLYTLVSLPRDEQRTLTVTMPHGISAYDFTFGWPPAPAAC